VFPPDRVGVLDPIIVDGKDPEQMGRIGAIVLFVITGKSLSSTSLLVDAQTLLLPE
jgi:hypothetical protein